MVELCAMGGIPQQEIAGALGISSVTLRKYFRGELDTAYVMANAKVVQTAFEMAVSGKTPAMTIFWLKARMGWSEKGPKCEDPADTDILAEVEQRIEEMAEYTLQA
jgi:transcriptional regulator with XRE-family HTH domain